MQRAGSTLTEIMLPEPFMRLGAAQALIHRYEAAQELGWIRREHAARVSDTFRAMIDAGTATSEADYAEARTLQDGCRKLLPEIFADVDLLLAPGAPGVAPEGLGATGDPMFCRGWTLLGLPSIHLPFAQGHHGLPIGLQIAGRRFDDLGVLRISRAFELLRDAQRPWPEPPNA